MERVTASLFPMLGVQPVLGRAFDPEDVAWLLLDQARIVEGESPSEQMFSVVERSPAEASPRLEILTGMASRVLFSSLPDPIGIW